MRQIIASRPARKLTSILFVVALTTGGWLSASDAGARIIRARHLDPNPVLRPEVGSETKIYYSIPQEARDILSPGTLVSILPSGCSTKHTSDLTYYDCSDVYFQPYYKGNQLVYMVIDKP